MATSYSVNSKTSGYTGDILNAVNQELRAYWPPVAHITRDVAFDMEAVLNRARKNYWGVFETPTDPVTGNDKTWVPLTEATVETIVKSADIDVKDIQIFPTNPNGFLASKFLRPIVKHFLGKLNFGQLLNDLIRAMVIDGTAIVKVVKSYSRDLKEKITNVKLVDPFNFYIDPTAESIQSAPSVIERVIMSKSQIDKYEGKWKNLENVYAEASVPKTPDSDIFGRGVVPEVPIFERWGKIKLCWLKEFNGEQVKEEDEEKWVDGVVIASGKRGSIEACHLHFVGLNDRPGGLKPYEEGWYRRMRNRWLGRGVPEQLFGLQEYLNTIFNIRKNNALVLQNGIFLIRKGSGITPQKISALVSGGALLVTDLDRDIKQLPTQDFRASSYKDEEVGNSWARAVAMGINEPASVAPSAPATTALAFQQSSRDIFDLIQEGIGLMLKRLLKNHLIPQLIDDLTPGELVEIVGSNRDLQELDELYVQQLIDIEAMKYYDEQGFWPNETEIERERQKMLAAMRRRGQARFFEYKRSLFDIEYDVEVEVRSETLDKAVLAQNLRDMIIAYSRVPGINIDVEKIFEELMNLLGMRVDIYKSSQAEGNSANASLTALMTEGQSPLASPRILQELPENQPTATTPMENAYNLPNVGVRR